MHVTLLQPFAMALEIAGVLAIVGSVILATGKALFELRRGAARDVYDRYRANIGRGILLGLELLVGADIIATVTARLTWETVGLLGFVVLIRTFLSFSLETEIQGMWPWERHAHERASARR